MRTRLLITGGLLLALLVPVTAGAAERAPLLITGGGQVVVSTDMQMGPGDTIAFGAVGRGTPDADGVLPATGSTQVVTTSDSDEGSQPTIIFNGEVTCIVDNDDPMTPAREGRFGGVERRDSDGDGVREPFVVDVVDTGDENRGTDEIEFRFTDNPENPCDDNEMGTILEGTTLARGNLKVDTAGSGRR